MTDIDRLKRIGQALEIIGRDRARRVDIERSVRFIDGMKAWLAARPTRANDEKAAAARVARSLRRAEAALTNEKLPTFLRGFPELEDWRKHYEALAKVRLDKPKRRDADAKRVAAAEAAFLLERYGLPIKVTLGNQFCRLAAVLYGEPRANFYHHCLAAKKIGTRSEIVSVSISEQRQCELPTPEAAEDDLR